MIKFCINKYDKFRVYTYFCSMATLEKVILGIDPGTNILGYGVIKLRGNKAKMEAMGGDRFAKVQRCLPQIRQNTRKSAWHN